jgi:hypothetical protein
MPRAIRLIGRLFAGGFPVRIIRIVLLAAVASGWVSAISAQTPPATPAPAVNNAPAQPPAPPAVVAPQPPPPVLIAAPAQPAAPAKAAAPWKDDCINRQQEDTVNKTTKQTILGGQNEIHIYRPGPELLSATSFLPAGGTANFVLKESFRPEVVYFGRIETGFDKTGDGDYFEPFPKDSFSAKQIPPEHPLIARGLASKSDTLVTVQIPDEVGGLWRKAKVYVYACTKASPDAVSSVVLPASSARWSGLMVVLVVVTMYLGGAVASRSVDPTNPGLSWTRYLDPVFMTAGADGKGSLAKLQILFFSMIVFGLLAYIVSRTGLLSDLSSTILMLLGIAAIGSTAAKGADIKRNRIDVDNLSWFVSKGWLPAGGLAAVNNAKWRDIITSDGEFDVYRYQNCIFSLVVGAALLAAGINQLSSFTVPETVLGVLGLSQVVYLAGKLVSPPTFDELNAAGKKVIELEDQILHSRAVDPASSPPGSPEYAEYEKAAKRAHFIFESVTGRKVPNLNLV